MTEDAYSRRDLRAIRRRKRINDCYKRLRSFYGKIVRFKSRANRRILANPEINDGNVLSDFINTVSWAFPYKKDLCVKIPVSSEIIEKDSAEIRSPEFQRRYIDKNDHIRLTDNLTFKEYLDADIILVHAAGALLSYPLCLFIYKTVIVDKYYYSITESGTWRGQYFQTFTDKEKNEYSEISKKNYLTLLEQNKNKEKAYCFATGPSFDSYGKYKYERNSFKIICNSIVKNREFLEHIEKPDLLVFSDAVFHFSPSEYSAVFRDNVLSVIRDFQCFIMVPEMTVPLLLAHYPELESRIIGIRKGNEFNFPTPDRFWIKGTANILSQYMLPVASTVSDTVFIVGADGRKPDEKYFWKHSASVQFDDLMQTAFKTHPSFFRDRNYEDYYDRHCQTLEKLILFGEKQGRHYFSLTPSYIPALKSRSIKG